MLSARTTLALLAAVGTQIVVTSEASAEQSTGVFVGTVQDAETKAGVEGVAVVVTSPSLQGEEMVVTDSTGHYRLPNLPPGVYQIAGFKAGYREYTRTNITLQANQTLRVNLPVIPESSKIQEQSIVVTSPTVDVGSTKTGMNITQDFSRRVPVIAPGGKGGANRSFEGAAVATPGARSDAYGTSISGTTSPENGYTIDGLSVSNPAYGLNGTPLSSEFVGEINVISGGYLPEYGRSIGGVIDAVTKSGSNEFHGGVWMNITPGSFEGQRKNVEAVGSTMVTETKLRYQGDIGFDIGGYIVKDKVWFYAGFDIARTEYDLTTNLWSAEFDKKNLDDDGLWTQKSDRNKINGTEENYRAQGTNIQGFLKFTIRLAKNHKLAVNAIVAPSFSGGGKTFGISPRTGAPEVANINGDFDAIANRFTGGPFNLGAKWNASTDSKKVQFQTKIGWHHERVTQLPSDSSGVGTDTGLAGQPQISWRKRIPAFHSIGKFIDLEGDAAKACEKQTQELDDGSTYDHDPCPTQTWLTGGPGFINEQIADRIQAKHVTSIDFQAGGHHTVKAGVDFEYDSFQHQKAYTGTTALREGATGSLFYDYRRYGYNEKPDVATTLDKLAWTTRFVVAGGFIQDSWAIADKVTLNAGLRYDAQVVFGGGGEAVLVLADQWSPRVGLIWDPTQKGKSKIFANYARFYQMATLGLADRAGSIETRVVGYHAAGEGLCEPLKDARSKACLQDTIDLHGEGTDQNWVTSGGGKTPVDPDIKSQSSDEIVIGGDYEIFKNASLGLSYTKRWINRIIEDMSRDEATTYFLGNPGEGIAEDFPEGKRDYDAINLVFNKRWADNWLLTANYTLAWLRGNFSGLFRPETGQLDPNINSDFDLATLLPNRYGWLPGDRRHDIKVFSAGQIQIGKKFAIDIGGSINLRSGDPSHYYGGHEIYGNDESFLLPRGSGKRLPWFFRLDTRLGVRYVINKSSALELTMDVFNLIGTQIETLRDSTWTQDAALPLVKDEANECKDPEPIENPKCLEGLKLADGSGNEVTKNPNFGNPRQFQTPRQFRFGLRFTF